jgi:hypothetical protein
MPQVLEVMFLFRYSIDCREYFTINFEKGPSIFLATLKWSCRSYGSQFYHFDFWLARDSLNCWHFTYYLDILFSGVLLKLVTDLVLI